MASTQAKDQPIVMGPRISMFDKKGQASSSRFTKIPNMPQKSERVSIPTVRINQHKGA